MTTSSCCSRRWVPIYIPAERPTQGSRTLFTPDTDPSTLPQAPALRGAAPVVPVAAETTEASKQAGCAGLGPSECDARSDCIVRGGGCHFYGGVPSN